MENTLTTIMTTEQYAKEVYCKYSKTNTASQQRIRKMIKDGKPSSYVFVAEMQCLF